LYFEKATCVLKLDNLALLLVPFSSTRFVNPVTASFKEHFFLFCPTDHSGLRIESELLGFPAGFADKKRSVCLRFVKK